MLSHLLNQPDILWRGDQCEAPEGLDAGFQELSRLLGGNGWPAHGVIELIGDTGSGELSLLFPALRDIQKQQMIAWVSPPWLPHGPTLNRELDLTRLLYIDAPIEHQQWSIEQSLKNSAIGAVVYWSTKELKMEAYRRLQILCSEHRKPCFLILQQAPSTSPSSVRLELHRQPQAIQIQVLKKRGQWSRPDGELNLTGANPFFYPVDLARLN